MPRHNSKPIDVWEALSEDLLRAKERRPEGKGWLQIGELAEKRGCSVNVAHKWVSDCGNRLDRFTGHLADNGKLKQKVWYRPKA